MKRFFLITVVLALFFSLASCGSAPKTESSVSESQPVTNQAPTPQPTAVEPTPVVSPSPLPIVTPVPVQPTPTPALPAQQEVPTPAPAPDAAGPEAQSVTVEGGGYSVEILSAFPDTDYTGAQVVVIKFMFTNSNSSPISCADVVTMDVRQNGTVLNGESVIMDSNSFGGMAFNFTKTVSNGASVPCVFAYPYQGDGDLDVTVKLLTNSSARQVLGSGSAVLPIG